MVRSLTQHLLVDIFADKEGVVQQVQYDKDIADHFSFDEVTSFSK